MIIRPLASLAGAAAILFIAISSTAISSQAPAGGGQAPAPLPGGPAPEARASYVGSASCRRCHAATYDRWAKTRMANVVTDPRLHPEAVIPDFTKPDPLLT